MFADSFSELSWANRSRRGWTTAASFAAEALLVGILLLLPLLYTQVIPSVRLSSYDVVLPPAGTPPQSSPPLRTRAASSNMANDGRMIAPLTIPRTIDHLEESVPPPPLALLGTGLMVSGGTGARGVQNPVFGSIGNAVSLAVPPATTIRRPLTSIIMEGNLIHRVQPAYPPLARQARIQGTVVLRALISKDGTIENLQVTSGHPMLTRAAVEAVRQWRYRPYYLNQQPIEVETQVTVNFILSGG